MPIRPDALPGVLLDDFPNETVVGESWGRGSHHGDRGWGHRSGAKSLARVSCIGPLIKHKRIRIMTIKYKLLDFFCLFCLACTSKSILSSPSFYGPGSWPLLVYCQTFPSTSFWPGKNGQKIGRWVLEESNQQSWVLHLWGVLPCSFLL